MLASLPSRTFSRFLTRFDKNGNEVMCVQLSPGKIEGNNPFGEFFYNVVDDNASKPL